MNTRHWFLLVLLGALAFGTSAAGSAQVPAAPPDIFTRNTRVLFQGNSITDGNRGRNANPNHILGHGYVFLIAAKYGVALPGQNLTFLNQGVSGNTVENLAKRWQTDTLNLKPDVLSILIGVNDASQSLPLAQYEQTYDRLLTAAHEANPQIRLVVCAPFALPVGPKKEGNEAWFADLKARQEIAEKLAGKYRAALVQFPPVFDAACQRAPANHWIWDGIHPTYSGHQLMADEWVRTVQAFWSENPD